MIPLTITSSETTSDGDFTAKAYYNTPWLLNFLHHPKKQVDIIYQGWILDPTFTVKTW
jgi:hypothetical protein